MNKEKNVSVWKKKIVKLLQLCSMNVSHKMSLYNDSAQHQPHIPLLVMKLAISKLQVVNAGSADTDIPTFTTLITHCSSLSGKQITSVTNFFLLYLFNYCINNLCSC